MLFVAAPAHAEYWEGDNFLACLVGKGVVEMRHGATADDALKAVRATCDDTLEPEPKPSEEPEGDWGDYLDAMYGLALDTLRAAEAQSGLY